MMFATDTEWVLKKNWLKYLWSHLGAPAATGHFPLGQSTQR